MTDKNKAVQAKKNIIHSVDNLIDVSLIHLELIALPQ